MWRINFKLANQTTNLLTIYNQKCIPTKNEVVVINGGEYLVHNRVFDYDSETITITVRKNTNVI